MHQKRSLILLAVVLFSLGLFAACGGGGGGGGGVIEITSISQVGTIDTGDSIDVVAHGDYLYYVGWGNTTEAFGIIDFSDPSNPQILGTYDVGSGYGVAFDGRYAFVETDGGGAGAFANGTVGVLDCQDPNNPVEVDDNDLGYSSAYDVELSGNYLYNFSSDIIGVYDVSDPTSLTWVRNVDTYDAEFGKIVGDYLYTGYDDGLVIYDVSDPSTMVTQVGFVSVSETETVYSATSNGTTAFAAGDAGGNYYIFSVDVSSPSTPAVIGSVETPSSIWAEMRILDGYLLAVGSNDFVVIDISDPANMTLVDSVTMSNGEGWGFDVSGRYAIVGDDTQLRIIQLY